MADARCLCNKILFQTETPPDENIEAWQGARKIIIKCRHCKRYMVIHVSGVEKVEYTDDPEALLKEESVEVQV